MHIFYLVNCAFDSPASGMRVVIPHNMLKSEKKQTMKKQTNSAQNLKGAIVSHYRLPADLRSFVWAMTLCVQIEIPNHCLQISTAWLHYQNANYTICYHCVSVKDKM